MFERSKVKSGFNKAAKSYSKLAVLQKITSENLIKFSHKYIENAQNIIDLGSGTGFVSDYILSNFKNNSKQIIQLDLAEKMLLHSINDKVLNVNADIEFLPFRNHIFDLAISSMAFQWLNDLKKALLEIKKILKSQGILAFSIIGNESLNELKAAKINCGVDISINNFLSEEELETIFLDLTANFEIKSEIIRLEYDDIFGLLKSIKSIGAGYSFNKSSLTKNDFNKINNFYLKNFNSNNRVFCHWQIFYIICKF